VVVVRIVVAIASWARDMSPVGHDCVGGSRPEPHVGLLPFGAIARRPSGGLSSGGTSNGGGSNDGISDGGGSSGGRDFVGGSRPEPHVGPLPQ
jgi:uncharacterized membrane protein YgcG